MSDITITVTEIVDGVSVESSPTTLTVSDGGVMGARFVLLETGVTTPPAGTPVGSLIFQKGA